MGILKKGRPIESTQQNLCSRFLPTEMPSTRERVTKIEYTLVFTLGYTSPDDLVGAALEKFGILPKIQFHLGEETIFILLGPVCRNLPYC